MVASQGGLVLIGEIKLDGSIDPITNAVNIVKLAVGKCAQPIFTPVSSRRQLFDLSNDMATKVDVQFYAYARDTTLKAMVEL